MRILSIDLSLHAGWALLEDDKVLDYGLQEGQSPTKLGSYPWSYLKAATSQARALKEIVDLHRPEVVLIEEVNKGRNRHSQKLLDGLHFALLQELEWRYDVKYVDTSAWRKTLSLKLTKEQRAANKLSKAKKKTLGIKGKVTPKHLAIAFCSEYLGKSFKVKDNDICDAIALGIAFVRGCPVSTP